MVMTLVALPERCTGCHRCEMWCSLKHKGVINVERAAIHVLRREPSIDNPTVCLQCGICIGSCPKDLIKRNRKTGAVEIDIKECTSCGHCVLSCPYGMIILDPVDRHAVKCDLCGGQPECTRHCREEAILYVPADKAALHRREAIARKPGDERQGPNLRGIKAG
jgi:Fe-S-cluster-containing hydrogenase component 2